MLGIMIANVGEILRLRTTAQLLHQAELELRRTLVDVAVQAAQEGGFQNVGQRTGTEQRPVLSTLESKGPSYRWRRNPTAPKPGAIGRRCCEWTKRRGCRLR